MSSVQIAGVTDNDFPAEIGHYEPTAHDWDDYRAYLRERELTLDDYAETMERIRRDDFNAALSAACAIRSIAVVLGASGYESIPVRLLQAASEVEALVHRYGR